MTSDFEEYQRLSEARIAQQARMLHECRGYLKEVAERLTRTMQSISDQVAKNDLREIIELCRRDPYAVFLHEDSPLGEDTK